MCLQVVSEVYKLYGWKGKEEARVIENSADLLMNYVEELKGDWIKVIKYKLAVFFSSLMDKPEPTCPWTSVGDIPDTILGGSARTWLRTFRHDARRHFHRNTHLRSFCMSVIQSKNAMPRPGPAYVLKSVESTVKDLTTPVAYGPEPAPVKLIKEWAELASIPDSVTNELSESSIKKELKRTVREIFEGTEFLNEDRWKPFFPSTSSNYINNRKGAGAVGTILENSELFRDLRTPNGVFPNLTGNHEAYGREMKSRHGSIKVVRKRNEEERGDDAAPKEYSYSTKVLEERFSILWERMLEEAVKEKKLVKAVGLPEALKVRTISKGPPYTYSVLKSIQKKVHDILRQEKTFQFIGKPNDEEGILKALGRALPEGQAYLSGDYKAATDKLKSWVSETIVEELSDIWELKEEERQIFLDALTHHIFDTKDGELQQTMGQLMGSIASFPILCIANAALCRWAMELADKKVWKLRDAPLTVNGDDVALRSNASVYKFWKTITTKAGLEESVGKTFLSRDWVMINSTMYQREQQVFQLDCINKKGQPVVRDSYLREVPFVNMGLMLGEQRSGSSTFDLDDLKCGITFSSRAKALIETCPVGLRSAVYKKHLQINSAMYKETRLPWFMPEWIGGLGLPRLDPEYHVNSKIDYHMATQIIMDWNKKHPVSLADQNLPWMVRRVIQKHLPETTLTNSKDGGVRALQQVESMLAINCLFDSNVVLETLYTPSKEIETSKVRIRSNARFWDPSKSRKVPYTVDDEFLYGMERYEGLAIINESDTKSVKIPIAPMSYRAYVRDVKKKENEYESNDLD